MMILKWRRPDGTFVAKVNGVDFHVTPNDPVAPAGLWNRASAEAERLGEALPFEPVPPVLSGAEILAARRAAATIDRGPLCKALYAGGMLGAQSAVEASKGNWPPEFAAFLSSMGEAQQIGAQIDWADATIIRYANPLLQQVALAYTQGDAAAATALLDQIFGIGA